MQLDESNDIPDLDDAERALFARLPREAAVASHDVDRTVKRLEDAGFFRPVRRRISWPFAAAAAVGVFALGIATGAWYTRRNSLEELLSRRDLSADERVLVLQRAGSAYVRAAQGYADATAHIDSSAVEVASRVLLGAAHAVARTSLDGGLSARLSSVLQAGAPSESRTKLKPVIWF
jgi:hypothetical protein